MDGAAALRAIHAAVTAAVDGEVLVRAAVERAGVPRVGVHPRVLALGKAALPMLRGFGAAVGAVEGGLAITTGRASARDHGGWPSEVAIAFGDHPAPTARSAAAADAALALVRGGAPDAPLWVLLSGGASALVASPAAGLSLPDKRAAVAAVAAAGATIRQINAVRKHLSAVKGGQLALAARGPVTVLALSDVVGDDVAVIGSGPFAPDPSTFADAEAAVNVLGVELPGPAAAHLARGVRGEIAETPKPGDARLAHVTHHVVAGPAAVVAAAERAAAAQGLATGALARDTEEDVASLAEAILERAARELASGGDRPRVLIGNGEPRLAVPPSAAAADARGGRSTHLALLVARGLARLPAAYAQIAFLAAGTDDRDGNAGDDVVGAAVDGATWLAAGPDPEAALHRFDSATALATAGALVHGPGTSNLLDLHILYISPHR